MTWEQYWHGDTWMVGTFRQADELRQERQNQDAWLQGVYFAKAISSTIGNAFREKGQEPDTYPDQPFPLRGEMEESEQEKENREEQEAVWALAWMSTFVEAGKGWEKH